LPAAAVPLAEVGLGVLAPTATAAETLLSAPALAPGLASAPTALAPGAGVLAPGAGGGVTAAELTTAGLPQTVEGTIAAGEAGQGLASVPQQGFFDLPISEPGQLEPLNITKVDSGLTDAVADTGFQPTPDQLSSGGTDAFFEAVDAGEFGPGATVVGEASPLPTLGNLGNTEKLLLAYGGATLLEELMRDKEGGVGQGTPYGGEFVNSGREINPEAFASGGGSGERDYYFNKGGLVGSRRSANRDFYGAYDPYRGRRIR